MDNEAKEIARNFQLVISRGVNRKFAGKEKRRHPRVAVSWPASILTAGEAIDAEIKNVSLGGALIMVRELPEMHGSLDLVIEIPEHQYILVITAGTVRFDIYDGDNLGPFYGFGVRFLDILEEDLRFLSEILLP